MQSTPSRPVLPPRQSSALLLASADAVARRFNWNLDRLSLVRRTTQEEPMSLAEAIKHLHTHFAHDRTERRRIARRILGDVRLAAMPNTTYSPRGNRAWRRGAKARVQEDVRAYEAARVARLRAFIEDLKARGERLPGQPPRRDYSRGPGIYYDNEYINIFR